jgi:hypothetical protein
MAQLGEIRRNQRIRRRNRRIGNARVHRAQAEQRMLEIIAGQNGNRPLRRKPAIHERLSDSARLSPGFGIA